MQLVITIRKEYCNRFVFCQKDSAMDTIVVCIGIVSTVCPEVEKLFFQCYIQFLHTVC